MKRVLSILTVLLTVAYVFGQPFTHSELGWRFGTVSSVNYPPTADNAIFLLSQGDVLTNYIHGYDTDSVSSVWYSIRSSPSGATLTLNTNTGSFVYTPTNNFTGTDAWSFFTFENDGPLFTNGFVSLGVMPTNGNGSLCIPVQTNVLLVVVFYGYQTNIVTQYTNGTKIVTAINSPWTGYNQTYCIQDTLGSFNKCFIHFDGDPITKYTPSVPWFTNISVPVGDMFCFSNTNVDVCGGVTRNITNVSYTTFTLGGAGPINANTNNIILGNTSTAQSNGVASVQYSLCNAGGTYSLIHSSGNIIWRYNTGASNPSNGVVWVQYSANNGTVNTAFTLNQTNQISSGYDFFNTNSITFDTAINSTTVNTNITVQLVVSNFVTFLGGNFQLNITNTLQ